VSVRSNPPQVQRFTACSRATRFDARMAARRPRSGSKRTHPLADEQPAMRRYRDESGASGVRAYALLADGIAVEFRSGDVYVYTAASAGPARIAHMRRLAEAGAGLSTYISRHVRERYAAHRPPSR
jgi:hypothetical protein